jgi:hypothetical protein
MYQNDFDLQFGLIEIELDLHYVNFFWPILDVLFLQDDNRLIAGNRDHGYIM